MDRIATLMVAAHESALHPLRAHLLHQGDIKLLDDAGDTDAVRLTRAWHPHVALLDGGSYGAGTIATLARIHGVAPETKTLVFVGVITEQYVVRALSHGASGCLRFGASLQQVLTAIRTVHAGELWASRKLLAHGFRSLLASQLRPLEDADVQLSPRELQIVAWMRLGMTNKEIARELGISDTTVKTHAHNIFHKTSTSGRVRLLQKLQAGGKPVQRANGKDKLRLALRRPAPMLGTA